MICWGSQAREEQGLATVWALALIAVLSLVALVVAGRTALVGARHRAESAADLAALAGAVAARDGADPCAAAAAIAQGNHGRLITCTAERDVVEVSVAVRSPMLWGSSWQQVGVARAGPATAAHSRGSESK
jgi:secretion/DNA translocation related TadE-like protein